MQYNDKNWTCLLCRPDFWEQVSLPFELNPFVEKEGPNMFLLHEYFCNNQSTDVIGPCDKRSQQNFHVFNPPRFSTNNALARLDYYIFSPPFSTNSCQHGHRDKRYDLKHWETFVGNKIRVRLPLLGCFCFVSFLFLL